MNHSDHVLLLKQAIEPADKVWADLGSGEGAFTLALRDIGGKDVEIYSVDKYAPSLQVQEKKFRNVFPDSRITYLHIDFTEELPLPQLDGIVMANSLHFLKNQTNFLKRIRRYLKQNGKLVLVEYNASDGNAWVPYPISFEKLKDLARESSFTNPKLLHTVPSQFLNEIYSAVMQNS